MKMGRKKRHSKKGAVLVIFYHVSRQGVMYVILLGGKKALHTHTCTQYTHMHVISTCNSPEHGKQIYPNLDPVHHLLKISTIAKYIPESE